MSTLYELDDRLTSIVNIDGTAVDTETGEIIEPAALDELAMEYNEKLEGCGLIVLQDAADIAAIDAEIKRLQARKKALTNHREGLKAYMAQHLPENRKFKTPRVSMYMRKSDSVELEEGFDVRDVNENYLRYRLPELLKNDLKKAIKAGEHVDGVKLVEHESLVVR